MEQAIRDEYFELLRFPSVGANPAHFKDCLDCASWWRRWLGKLGFSSELLYPAGRSADGAPPPPTVFAEREGSQGTPTVLVYGHYDVQPAEPLDAWITPPFEPTVVDGARVRARGAQDNKGQTFAFLCGLRDLVAQGARVPTVKVLLEGQEESGSAALSQIAPTMARRLAADVLLVCDTSAAAELRPAIVAGLRGVVNFSFTLRAANRDLHSGEYGGVAPNAAQGAAELAASLHAPSGAIAVEGFCAGVEPPTDEELRRAAEGLPDEAGWAADIGCPPEGGEAGVSAVVRNGFAPTIEVNGIHSGYGGPGSKTVIPCEAEVKLSMRLVPGQDAARCLAAVRAHLAARCPRGMALAFSSPGGGAGGFRLPLDSPLFRLASGVLAEMDARGPVFQWDGASIPVVSVIREASGAAPLLVGWGQAEDRIHSPNESYSFVQFEKARDWARRILCSL